MDLRASSEMIALQAFRSKNGLNLIKHLYSRRVLDGAQISKLILFPSMPATFNLAQDESNADPGASIPTDGVQLTTLSKQFLKHLERYLGGCGHLDCDLYNDLVSSSRRAIAKQDIAFRARQFVYHMTGSNFLSSSKTSMEASTLVVH